MHIHILGICGTFMGGIAALARAAGHRVTGSDSGVYPPMSEQLTSLGIELIEGYEPGQLRLAPDIVVVGNVMSRGNTLIEALLESGIPYTSGPDWLARHVLTGRWTLAVAGTHGKTTTASVLTWILEHAGLDPGFLIGGIPDNFAVSARLGTGAPFVVEADEYDTAFFDKRAKFVHYRPRTAILNNLEHDHADIYPDVASIQWQFQQLLRMVPRNGLVVANAADAHVMEVIAKGCWSPVEHFAGAPLERDGALEHWHVAVPDEGDYTRFAIMRGTHCAGTVDWAMPGRHNAENALAAILAARHAGVDMDVAIAALKSFKGVRRRMEIRGVVRGITVYDDFAHHPTAVAATIEALRRRVGSARLVAVLEPRSNTMKLGTHREALAGSLELADRVWLYQGPNVQWDVAGAVAPLGERARVVKNSGELTDLLVSTLAPGDHVLIMSNGGFDGIHGRLLDRLADTSS
ncbi:UDP-N-acetylmuramate:L-alanyl-gamma-D-glutamyl-meso-diaminopimelate ligase [Steroidobacter denitrificans]|uniref:UDP-N-acetylmuramate--L-alanyl-gamma-D-glutamyl-meso-2,6-diaminoheptandioate ligase n=1 Tax=Steroidobacter denitrificans TaxID=465721 RepID=A0A127F8Y8_STEDE|nr:UDP-N-acetylmuramate:L-alanyl-gamma-D-glutamyl-meso-diaminopimelate ligase [Steroidobacter denitrificans]AMN46101.1 UDP-N-acetylmuramate:L-alanyl-gamma-D-glutamyl-meso-diaminopimelate ligase [Steroidobacter denitrificans]